jgi:hypothetical protein
MKRTAFQADPTAGETRLVAYYVSGYGYPRELIEAYGKPEAIRRYSEMFRISERRPDSGYKIIELGE